MQAGIPRHWRLKAERYRLIGQACLDCHNKIFPPQEVCPHCAEAAKLTSSYLGEAEERLIQLFIPNWPEANQPAPVVVLAAA